MPDENVLCSEGEFRVVQYGDRIRAQWKNHRTEFGSIEELKEAGILNKHELQLLEFEVKR